MIRNCLYCNSEFTPKRSDAKFCSSICRAKHSNTNRNPNPEQTQVNATNTNATGNPPVVYPMMGLGNPGESGYMQQRIRELEAENKELNNRIKEFEFEEKQRLLEANAPKSGFLGFGSARELMEHPIASELVKGVVPMLQGFLQGKNNNALSSGSGYEGLFAGIEDEKRDNLMALVEILKPQPDSVLELFLGLAGKSSENPDLFLQGVNEGAQQLEEVQQNWMP